MGIDVTLNSLEQKTCSKCKDVKNIVEFSKNICNPDGRAYYCKLCIKPYNSTEKALEKKRISSRIYHKKNVKKETEYSKIWSQKNPEKRRLTHQKQHRTKYKIDVQYTLKKTYRNRIRGALKGTNKNFSSLQHLGCSIEQLKAHLEAQFRDGMNWQNYGQVWHVDHIIPLNDFYLQYPTERDIALHYTNLRPLLVHENLTRPKSWFDDEAARCL